MSQKNPSKAPVPRRVSSGLPWWIWVIGVGFALLLLAIIVPRLFPTDPQVIFDDAMVLLESQTPDVARLTDDVEKLKEYPDWAGHVKYLEARMAVGRNMPLKAIPLLVEAMKSEKIRGQSGLLLGRAYGTAGKFEQAISTLESVLDDPEIGDEARYIAASILSNGLAYNESLAHIKVLKEKGHKPVQVNQLEGDILVDFGRYEEAAAAYKKSLDESGDSPAVGELADRYLQCLVRLGKITEADEYVDMIEDPTRGSKFQALSLLGKGKVTEALTVIDSARRDMPLSGEGAVIAAKVNLAEKNVEKIKAELPALVNAVGQMSRNREAFETLAAAAEKIGNAELANSARKNAEQLLEIENEMRTLLQSVVNNRNDVEGRLKVASLAIQCGQFDFAKRILESLSRFYPEAESKANAIMPDLMVVSKPLVPLAGLTEPEPEQPKSEDPKPDDANPADPKPEDPPQGDAKPVEPKLSAPTVEAPKN